MEQKPAQGGKMASRPGERLRGWPDPMYVLKHPGLQVRQVEMVGNRQILGDGEKVRGVMGGKGGRAQKSLGD